MSKLEQLYEITKKNNIEIVNSHFSDTKKAACIKQGNLRAIIMDKSQIESQIEEKVVLSEEIGHYVTESLYMITENFNKEIEKSNRIKCEEQAKRWAIRKILKPQSIEKAIKNGCNNDFEVAEHCEVTIDFLKDAYSYYAKKDIIFEYFDDSILF